MTALPRVFHEVGGLGTGSDRSPRAWPKFMTARVAADYTDSSPWTIRRNVRPCGKRGRSFVYAIESVEAWMRGAAIEHASPGVSIDRSRTTTRAPSGARGRELGRVRVEGDRQRDLASDLGGVAA